MHIVMGLARETQTQDCPTPRPALLTTAGTALLPKGTYLRATLLQGKPETGGAHLRGWGQSGDPGHPQ